MRFINKEKNSKGITIFSFKIGPKELRLLSALLTKGVTYMPVLRETVPTKQRLLTMRKIVRKTLEDYYNEDDTTADFAEPINRKTDRTL